MRSQGVGALRLAPSIRSHTNGSRRLITPRFGTVIARRAPAALMTWYAVTIGTMTHPMSRVLLGAQQQETEEPGVDAERENTFRPVPEETIGEVVQGGVLGKHAAECRRRKVAANKAADRAPMASKRGSPKSNMAWGALPEST